MVKIRQKRCIITLLPLLGILLLLFGIFQTKIVQDGNLASTSKSILKTLQFAVKVNDERVMLLEPMRDESKLVKVVPVDTLHSQIHVHIQDDHSNGSLLSSEGLLAIKEVSLLRSNTLDKSSKTALIAQHKLDNPTDTFRFQAVNPALHTTPEHSKIQILIVTNRRSGSSFLGQFFNQHPDVFFQFEPLKLTEWKQEFYPDGIEYLRHLLKCQFDKTPYLVEFYNREPLHRASSKVMNDFPLCNLTESLPKKSRYKVRCPPLETLPLIQTCQKKQHQTIKLIRLYSIASLEPIALDHDINLKIIHLVRDPRATYISRSRIPGANVSSVLGKSLDAGISYLCRRINRNLDFIRSQPAWLQGKYKLVRYEDIANNPKKLAQEIYKFTGLGQLPQEVLKWIQSNTQKSAIKPNMQPGESHYSTTRNASQVPEAWRYEVPLKVVLRMQEFCRETLRYLGYREVRTTKELLDKNRSLVAQLKTS
ncbi:carbohydrate sulfotransferase 1-like [Patiria miniata]|uniref:Sulfotransferase domain-containing protein n=1 Tax=Patiria miniata TaxID=46514 RepID=A0A914B3H7_PATMI|nr:carbohydrate sulfotransferase 1-like [Patiria miniata]